MAVVGGLVDFADRKATEATERARLQELEQFRRTATKGDSMSPSSLDPQS